jgi:hypothetical protein
MGAELGWGRRDTRRAGDVWLETVAAERLVSGEPVRA